LCAIISTNRIYTHTDAELYKMLQTKLQILLMKRW